MTLDNMKALFNEETNATNAMDTINNEENNGTEIIVVKRNEVIEHVSEFQAKSEDDLIDHAREIHSRIQGASILGYWEIGRSINAFYKGTYGTNELGRISAETGIGRDTLNKMCKFGKQYTREQTEGLLHGNFPITWNSAANNLTVEPAKLVETYQTSNTADEFHNGIMKLKSPTEQRRKSRGKTTGGEGVRSVVDELVVPAKLVEVPPPESYEASDEIDQSEIDDGYQRYARELEELREENQRLQLEITIRDGQLETVNAQLKKLQAEIIERDKMISDLQKNLTEANEKLDHEIDGNYILSDKLSKVVSMLEEGARNVDVLRMLEEYE